MSDLKQKVMDMFEKHQVGTLATIRNGKPYSRFMLFFHEDLTLYAATNKETHKVEDMESNPNVHILLGLDAKGFSSAYCEIEATASVEDSNDLRTKYWNDHLKEWMSGPDDPNYVLLKLQPDLIRYFDKAGSKPEELTL
ncbi:pyridoxamine 5'-phosphate oxidase family protein [Bacillus sp. 31A1R]|uniref:Pyridoxamine 5'-phosphate oxidase family protein n=1 Tax=Robertmurraya mangrovi TaxID=3098077 RepID=A0ABU5J2A0_9BACI|nr:pyridoxamine 5'-phosphate oxidase family protein [Bacillus sp. 31A1R]MDZ5473538.1 pyridoxamine 5'-phosphate oxidase family protein [Bacillus sp. 31A1R]